MIKYKSRFSKIRDGRYTIQNCNKTTFIECSPEKKAFKVLYLNMIISIKSEVNIKDIAKLADLQ